MLSITIPNAKNYTILGLFCNYSFAQTDYPFNTVDFQNNNQCHTKISRAENPNSRYGDCSYLSTCDEANLRNEFIDISIIDTVSNDLSLQ